MKSRIYWGLAILIILLVGVSVVMLTRTTDTKPPIVIYRGDVEPSKVNYVSKKQPNEPKQRTEPIGHYHADGSFHEGTHVEHANDVPEQVIYPHQELLDTHPVEALRQLAEEKGHWSAEFIPPFPADDTEAAELARASYITAYHWSTVPHTSSDSHGHTHSADFKQAEQLIEAYNKARSEWSDAVNKAQYRGFDPDELARWLDLDALRRARSLTTSPPPFLSRMRTWPSMFNDIRY